MNRRTAVTDHQAKVTWPTQLPIPVVDIFAGPGGLGEGFSSFFVPGKVHPFRVRLSVEKETVPDKTFLLHNSLQLSHLRKDGHYFIHPDHHQNRCLITREAARPQTFSGKRFSEGMQTAHISRVA